MFHFLIIFIFVFVLFEHKLRKLRRLRAKKLISLEEKRKYLEQLQEELEQAHQQFEEDVARVTQALNQLLNHQVPWEIQMADEIGVAPAA